MVMSETEYKQIIERALEKDAVRMLTKEQCITEFENE